MKKFLSTCLFLLSGSAFASNLVPLPETAQEQGWNIRLVGVHYQASTDQTEFFYRVRIEHGAATVTSWQLKLQSGAADYVVTNSQQQPLHWDRDLQPGTVELVTVTMKGERTTRASNYRVISDDLLAEGVIDVPSLSPLASSPMTASSP